MREDAEVMREAVLAFARSATGIEAVIETGSRARGQRVDGYSDLDLELIGPGAGALVGREDWLAPFGDVLIALHLENGGPDEPEWPTCLVVFAGGRKIDFTLAGSRRITDMLAKGLDATYSRGYRVLHDSSGASASLPPATGVRPQRPTADEFLNLQRDFWFEVTQVPTYLGRGDLWHGLLRLEEMRAALLSLLQWHTHAVAGAETDTWYLGHHIDQWVPADVVDALPGCFSGYDVHQADAALRSCAALFADVATRITEHWGLPLLDSGARVAAWLAAQPAPLR